MKYYVEISLLKKKLFDNLKKYGLFAEINFESYWAFYGLIANQIMYFEAFSWFHFSIFPLSI